MEEVIYKISFIGSKKVYVGKSSNYESRKYTHINSLRKGNHSNTHLQRLWDKYEAEWSVLETLNNINEAEIKWIKYYKDLGISVNQTEGGDGGFIHDGSKKIYQYDLNGKFIKEWKSAREINRKLGYGWSRINAVCRGDRNQSNGFIWKYELLDNIQPVIKYQHKDANPIIVTNKNGDFIGEFPSIRFFVEKYNLKKHEENFRMVVLGNRNHAGGYVIRYKNPEDDNSKKGKMFNDSKPRHARPVLQYDLEGNFIKEWPSLIEVKRKLGVNYSSLQKVCKNEQNTAGGFKWKFKVERNNLIKNPTN